MNLNTRCVHTGTRIPEGDQGVNTPIYTSSAYGYEEETDNLYPRSFNTINQQVVAEKLQALESGAAALIFSSGMAAISTAFMGLLRPGDHVVLQKNLYGGTHLFITTTFQQLGVEYSTAQGNSKEDFEAAWKPNTKFIYVETPSNPLLEVVDLKMISSLAKAHQAISMIDNTFASPINQRPIELGIDVVLHSATKYLGGHSDLSAGGIVTATKELMQPCMEAAVKFGGNLDASACALLERSMKTLALRVRQQNKNAQAIASFLAEHPQVIKVHYPGLPSHPGHSIAKAQMHGFGGMLSFEVNGGLAGGEECIGKLRLIAKALSLGGVETTICSPTLTSHAPLSPEERQDRGIHDGLLRLSVGIEDAEDIITDLDQALSNHNIVAV